ncbi:MAG: NAD-dependent epimerase/dehydratase family protein [Ilumatobacteraceae bacterium]
MAVRQRVLLTGATGHVGGRLLSYLSTQESVTTRALVRTPRTLPSWADSCEIRFGDLTEEATRRDVLQDVDCVVHLATRGFSSAQPPSDAELAIEEKATLDVVHDAIGAGVSRLIYISSIHVYGESLVGRVDDSTSIAPNTAYGRSRQRIERDILELAKSGNSQISVVRLTNSFGVPTFPRGGTWNLLLHDLCRQVVQSHSITLRSDGRVCRDMMALRDVVNVLAQILMNNLDIRGTFLLASGQTMKLKEIAELVQRYAKSTLGIDADITSPVINPVQPPAFLLHPAKLIGAGIKFPQHRDEEICDLLRHAQHEFGIARP